MAKHSSDYNNRQHLAKMGSMMPIRASCYVLSSGARSLKAFHYSTSGAGGKTLPFSYFILLVDKLRLPFATHFYMQYCS
jgi:hypothetical protein